MRCTSKRLTGGAGPEAHGSGDDVRLQLQEVSARLAAGAPSGGAAGPPLVEGTPIGAHKCPEDCFAATHVGIRTSHPLAYVPYS